LHGSVRLDVHLAESVKMNNFAMPGHHSDYTGEFILIYIFLHHGINVPNRFEDNPTFSGVALGNG